MSDPYLEKVAGELAVLALADEVRSGDEKIVGGIAEIVGSSSQTLQEAFLTAVRVRRAEARARALLAERAGLIDSGSAHLLTSPKTETPASEAKQASPEDELQAMLEEVDREAKSKRTAGTDRAPRPIMPSNPHRR
ncbi:MAG: hypothetical protein ACJAZ1_001554 [Yoonia sp.]|jgi:hypothetical protein